MTRAFPIVRAINRARFILLAILLVSGCAFLSPAISIAEEPADRIVVGERVVLRRADSVLRTRAAGLIRGYRENHFYRVEAVYGASVKLKIEGESGIGVVPKAEVVPVAAIADFSQVMRLDPEDSMACNLRGVAWAAKQKLDMAIASFNQALRLDPGNLSALKNRGSSWISKLQADKAVADFELALKLNPGDLRWR
jgi:tetratricopeptide (TPR) repeat protein